MTKQANVAAARLRAAIDAQGLRRADNGARPNGAIIWEGASSWDGEPIAVVLNWSGVLNPGSANDKTGAMIQSYIIPTRPEAIADGVSGLLSGPDETVCGSCPHRPALYKSAGESPCYVNVGQGVMGVLRAYHGGAYPRTDDAPALVEGLPVRFGSWGDPGMVPVGVWEALAATASSRTGYTHRWRDTASDTRWQSLVMASCDSPAEAFDAETRGWATFETTTDPTTPLRAGQARCPSDPRTARKTSCISCPLQCSGRDAGPIVSRQILVHGPGDIGRKINLDRKRSEK